MLCLEASKFTITRRQKSGQIIEIITLIRPFSAELLRKKKLDKPSGYSQSIKSYNTVQKKNKKENHKKRKQNNIIFHRLFQIQQASPE